MRLKKLLATIMASIMLFSITAMTASATDADTSNPDTAATAAPTAAATIAPTQAPDQYSGVGCYMGFFLIQTSSWVYRDAFAGSGGENDYGSDRWNSVFTATDPHATTTEVKDTVIDGDGEYTISLNNISLEGSTNFNMVGFSTNIALDSPITITAASLYYNDSLVANVPVQKNDNKKFRQIMFINQYDNAMKDTVNSIVPPDGTNMVIKFTVEGFGYPSKVVSEATTSDAAVTPVAAATSAPDEAAVPASDTAASEDNGDGGLPTGAIIGIIAGVAVIAVIVIIVISSKKKKK